MRTGSSGNEISLATSHSFASLKRIVVAGIWLGAWNPPRVFGSGMQAALLSPQRRPAVNMTFDTWERAGIWGGSMRIAAQRRTGWTIAPQFLEGTQRQLLLPDGEWVDVV